MTPTYKHTPNYDTGGYMHKALDPIQLTAQVEKAKEILVHYEFDAIAFRGMSGALLAAPIALALGKTLIMVRKPNDNCHVAQRVEGDIAATTYIIVDDFVCEGNTVRAIYDEVKAFNPKALCLGVYQAQRAMYNKLYQKLSDVPGRTDAKTLEREELMRTYKLQLPKDYMEVPL